MRASGDRPGKVRRLVQWPAVSSSRLPAISPMHPTLVREPFHGDGWSYEEKYDGWRIVAYKDGESVRLVSRNGRDHTSRFVDISRAVVQLPARSLFSTARCAPSTSISAS